MKSFLTKFTLVILTIVLAVLVLSSCDSLGNVLPGNGTDTTTAVTTTVSPKEWSLVLEADKTDLARGDTVTLSALLRASGEEDIPSVGTVFHIVSGADYITRSGNKSATFTVLDTVPHGAEIKIMAQEGATLSEVITLTVSVPVTQVSLSAGGAVYLPAGEERVLTTSVLPAGARTDVVFTATEGADAVEIVGNVLKVKSGTASGTLIKVKATVGSVSSEELSFTVGYPLSGISISAEGSLEILPGATAAVTVLKNPADAVHSDYELEFVNACHSYADIVGNVITVSEEAIPGTEIKVKAVSGSKESNVLTFTVGYPLEELTVSADGLNILAGGSATVTVVKTPTNATNGNYHLVFVNDCGEYASIDGNVITVSSDAVTGREIKVKAVSGDTESNVLTFTVGYPLEELTVSADGLNILAGGSAPVTVVKTPTNATNGNYHLVFVNDCGEYASIDGNVITVSSDAVTGREIKVKAVAGDKESNVLTFTVGYPLESITAKLAGSGNINPGSSATLSAELFPQNATNGSYEWRITEGAEHAEIIGNDTLRIKSGATLGATVKVKAVAGDIESNEITVTVGVPIEALTISSSAPAILDRGGNYPLILTATPEDAPLSAVEWEITEGGAYATVVNNVLLISHTTPAGTKVTLRAVSGSITSEPLSYTVGVKLSEIVISLGGVTNVEPGASATVTSTLTPDNATDRELVFVIDAGSEYATLVGGVLTVKSSAPVGEEISFHAEIGDVKSNSLTVTVGIPPETITISLGGVTNIAPGDEAVISATLTPTDASSVPLTWVIDAGGDYATLVDGVLTVKSSAPVGAKVTFHAEYGDVKSKSLTVTVGIPPETITISLGGVENVNPGDEAIISATLAPTDADSVSLSWVIDAGAQYATLADGVLTVKSTAPIGVKVTLHAEYGEAVSNSLTVTVGVPIKGITISAPSLSIVKGTITELEVSFNPDNASSVPISWQITQGGDFASVSKNNVLSVKASAPTDAVIKVVAVAGGVTSNELVFTVGATQEEINAGRYYIGLNSHTITVDQKGVTSPVLRGEVINANGDTVTDVTILYSITEGEEYLRLVQEGNLCTFEALGHGCATITATVEGGIGAEVIEVNVIVPPDAIVLPEVFLERSDISYAFSMVDPDTGDAESLPFLPGVRGAALSCTEYAVTFRHESGAVGDEVAVYENGAITFKKTGKVTATVSSKSGSYVEATAAYTFDINEGYNVYNFVELQQRITAKDYDGQIVNMVVLEKPEPQYETSYTYGYDMVPPSALYDLDAKYAYLGEGIEDEAEAKALVSAAIVKEILGGSREEYGTTSNRIQAINRSVWINGNNHKIDASQLRLYTKAEYDAYIEVNNKQEGAAHIGEMFSAIPWEEGAGEGETGNAHTVKFRNVEVVGNCPIDFKGEKDRADVIGCFTTGISIGALIETTTDYYVDCDNLTASGFKIGIYVSDAVGDSQVGDSRLSNITAYNCYASGLHICASHVVLENMTFGKNGACAIDIGASRCQKAGLRENENTRVTFAGTVDASENLSNGDTEYFKNYTVLGTPVPTVIGYNFSAMNETQRAHIQNEKGEYNFISLLVNDTSTFLPNESEVHYPAYQAGGIIDVSQLTDAVNTTHQYIMMDIQAEIPGMGIQTIGKAIFYNMNYGK